jgi:DNA-binding IclR family transcriptional regulator
VLVRVAKEQVFDDVFGVPIIGRDGRMRAALSMSYGLMDKPDEATMRGALAAAAERIGQAVAG